jgi:diacylglycerol O-acyltransferase / wax synthase
MASRERMSSVDTAWLRMDRPTNLMQIIGVMLFKGQLDYGRLRATIEQRMLKFRRFRQLVVADGSGYVWQDDPDFDLDRHLHRELLPAPGGKTELQHYLADLASEPLNPNRPLWDFRLIDTALGGQALIMRLHHSIADGIAMVGVILSMADDSPDAAGKTVPAAADEAHEEAGDEEGDDPFWETLWGPVSDAKAASLRLAASLRDKYQDIVQNPVKVLDYARVAGAIAAEVAKLAIMPDDSRTRLKGRPGAAKRVAWSEALPLPHIKDVGKVLGCSVNDLLLSAAAGAIRSYLVDKGDIVEGVEIRAMVPVNMRRPKDAGKLGNRFGLVAVELPVGIENPLARLYATRARMEELKSSYQAALTLSILGLVGMAPHFVQEQVLDLLASKATAVMTNVPGPKSALYLAGAKLAEPLFWVPQSGNIGIGVSILSYDNRVQFGLITDRKLVPDPERIVARFAGEFEKLLLLVLMEPVERLADPHSVEAGLRRRPARSTPVRKPPPPVAGAGRARSRRAAAAAVDPDEGGKTG